jgi:hypothetical protein
MHPGPFPIGAAKCDRGSDLYVLLRSAGSAKEAWLNPVRARASALARLRPTSRIRFGLPELEFPFSLPGRPGTSDFLVFPSGPRRVVMEGRFTPARFSRRPAACSHPFRHPKVYQVSFSAN